MRDFTLNTYRLLLTSLRAQNYAFQTFAEFLKNPAPRSIVLRHDVDARKMNSLTIAGMENEMGITGSYYFRIVPQSYDEEVIKQIAGLGHEIGYHYEDISRCAASGSRHAAGSKGQQDCKTARLQDKVLPEEELLEMAIASFRENLEKLRRVVPIETICMHGSPLSRWDNRLLWKYYDYRDYGIIGEPYFDVDFEEVLYLTDTGRRWNGDSVSIRDKVQGAGRRAQSSGGRAQRAGLRTQRLKEELPPSPSLPLSPSASYKFHSTFEIILAAKSGKLPDNIMITLHPQRWTNSPLPWMRELVWQNVKNVGKRIVVGRQK